MDVDVSLWLVSSYCDDDIIVLLILKFVRISNLKEQIENILKVKSLISPRTYVCVCMRVCH